MAALLKPLTHLGGYPVSDFLRDYWQQKPLLIRQAFPQFETLLSADELAGLACETDNARLVMEHGPNSPWEVLHGPLDEEVFARLPESHWTLLVNEVERSVPELQAILQAFRFIPDWRIDDLMVSFAMDGGSVGPHFDAYDVFLLQAQGRRHWQINTVPVDAENYIADIDLRVMKAFDAEQSWLLEPGDMLYLPPHIAHYGVAVGECMTYSVGFRAPSQAELLENLLEHLLNDPALQKRYSDKGRRIATDPAQISEAELERVTDFLMEALPSRAQLKTWLRDSLDSRDSSYLLDS